MAANDLTGRRFGQLVAIERTEKPEGLSAKNRNAFWLCQCDCGGVKIASAYNLLRGVQSHCGCRNRLNKQKAGKVRAAQLAERDVRNYKTPGGDNDLTRSLKGLVTDCKCAMCGTWFERYSPDWVYKSTAHAGAKRYFCSYKCWRADMAKQQKRPHGNSLAARTAEG